MRAYFGAMTVVAPLGGSTKFIAAQAIHVNVIIAVLCLGPHKVIVVITSGIFTSIIAFAT